MGGTNEFNKKTIKDVDINGKVVLLRADYNVPIGSKGDIKDDYRITQSLPTLRYLIEKKCKVVICSHLGRPNGKRDMRYSLAPVASHLSALLNRKVYFSADILGATLEQSINRLPAGGVMLLENTRFYAQEKNNDKKFAETLAQYADIFVQDAFGVVHRSHATTDAITNYLPSVAGLLLEKEYQAIREVIARPRRPLMTIVGGAKIADKISILQKFIELADIVVVGGAMANTFLAAKGLDVGSSVADKEELPLAREILEKAKQEALKRKFIFYLPQDSVVAKKVDKHAKTRIVDWDAHVIASIESYPKLPPKGSGLVKKDELILDIGPYSAAFIAGSMQMVETVIWNGVMGVTETSGTHGPVGPFSHGTELILESLMGQFGYRPYSFVGGGDTVAYIEKRGLVKCFDHVSTGGGASLDLLAGKKLPGLEALKNKHTKVAT